MRFCVGDVRFDFIFYNQHRILAEALRQDEKSAVLPGHCRPVMCDFYSASVMPDHVTAAGMTAPALLRAGNGGIAGGVCPGRIDACETYPVEGEVLASDSRKGAVVPVGLHREADDLRQLVAEYRGDIIGALIGGDVGHHKVHIRIGSHIEAELNSFVRRAGGVSCKLSRAQGHEGQGAGLGPIVRGRGGPGLKGPIVAHGLAGNIQLRFTAVLRPAPAVGQIPGP